jgi:hypothetical protein
MVFGFQYVQLDDGYHRDETGQHYWMENWDRRKLPHSSQWLTSCIKLQGLRAGIWFAQRPMPGTVRSVPTGICITRRTLQNTEASSSMRQDP